MLKSSGNAISYDDAAKHSESSHKDVTMGVFDVARKVSIWSLILMQHITALINVMILNVPAFCLIPFYLNKIVGVDYSIAYVFYISASHVRVSITFHQ